MRISLSLFKKKETMIRSVGPVEVELTPIAWDTIADNMRRMSSIKITDAGLRINGIDSGQRVEVILRKIAI